MSSAALVSLRRRDIARTADYRQTSNDSAVLQAVLDHGPVARSTIARLAGLSPAAVTRLSAELMDAGLLCESPQAAGPKAVGRPHVPVEIGTSRGVACGLHITGRYSTLALLDLRGHVIAEERLPHELRTGPRRVLSQAASRVPGFLARSGGAARRSALAWPSADGWTAPTASSWSTHVSAGTTCRPGNCLRTRPGCRSG